MRINTPRKGGFTLVEIMIVVAIIGLLASIAIPNFARARGTAQSNACINNKRQIEAAIQQWALETKQASSATPTTATAQLYLRSGQMPTCPTGNSAYVLGGTVNAATIVCGNEAGTTHVLP